MHDPLAFLDAAVQKYQPKHVIGLFSGGHDSLVATHVASRHPAFSFACHINTGIGIEQTRIFVRETCADWGVPLREYCAADYCQADGTPDPQVYRDLVIERGFPGPSMHSKMYQRLKEKALRMMIRDLDRTSHDGVLLISGIRRDESERRMAHEYDDQVWEGQKRWVAPIYPFSKLDVMAYIRAHGLPRNPVSDNLHMSGECLCGAFAKPGEFANLALWYPDTAAHIAGIERDVRAAGHEWGWEQRPPRGYRKDQMRLEFASPLCSSCILTHLYDDEERPA